jgi:hypothetical protein
MNRRLILKQYTGVKTFQKKLFWEPLTISLAHKLTNFNTSLTFLLCSINLLKLKPYTQFAQDAHLNASQNECA